MYNFKVKPDNGKEFTATATTRDVILWEKSTKGASLTKLQLEQKMTDLYHIAYLASKRLGLYDGTLADFEAQCDLDFEDDDEDDAAPFPKEA